MAAAHPSVDVVYFEQSSNITHNYLLRDGRLVPSVIADRLVARYGTSILSPTHNFPVLGAIDDIVMGRGVIGVGGHESKDNFFMNHGVRVEHDDNLLITGGYGPMGDGTLKPDIISPSNYVSTAQGFVDGRAIPGLFELPPGYTIAGGTSTATPTAAGAVALLISGARQSGMAVDPHQIKYAVTRGARYVPNIAAYKQGNGVISVEGAWAILNELHEGGLTVEIESRASIVTPYSHFLPTPHEGYGLYERSGWEAGVRGQRVATLTRTTGPSAPMTFAVSWERNDHGAFSSPLTVTLPLGAAVEFPITVTPPDHGVYTAHLTLDRPNVTGYAHRMLAAIVAPQPLNAAGGYTAKREVEVPRPGMHSLFFDVPEGVSALKLDLQWNDREVAMAVARPDTRYQQGETVRSGGAGVTRVIADPVPGTWEVRLSDIADTREFDWQQAKKEEPVPPTKATLTVSALAVDVDVVAAQAPLADNGVDNGAGSGVSAAPGASTHQVWMTNRMATFEGAAVTVPVGSARRARQDIAPREQQTFEIEVLPGTTALLVKTALRDAGGDPLENGDLDVYVFDCTGDECTGARADGDPVGDESVVVHNPAAGLWKVVVDGAALPPGGASYEYLDAAFNPAYGTVGAIDVPQERAPGARWTTTAQAWVASAAHAQGRTPYLAVLVEGRSGDARYWVALGEVAPR